MSDARSIAQEGFGAFSNMVEDEASGNEFCTLPRRYRDCEGIMEPKVIWIIVAIAIAAIVLLAFAWRQRRSAQLRQRFGREYDRAVEQKHDVRAAEAALEARARRVEKLHIKPLTPSDAAAFGDAWRKIQAQFVDDPKAAVTSADRLIGEVMAARGYPLDDFEQRADDLSVDHPAVVTNYRAAREIVQRHARGQASTEDLRQAMVFHRSLFDELLGTAAESKNRALAHPK